MRATLRVVLSIVSSVVLSAALLAVGGTTAQAQSGYELFQQALVKERAAGRLDAAIELYRRIVREYATDRALAAKVLVQLGRAYEKRGSVEATSAYDRVVRDYAEQGEEVAAARGRLAALRSTSGVAPGSVARRVWELQQGQEGLTAPRPSRDGRFLSYIGENSGQLTVRDLTTGATQILTKGEPGNKYLSVFSPDGRQVAYSQSDTPGFEIRVASTDGSTPRTVYRNAETVARPMDWFPDGRRILAVLTRSDRVNQIAVINVADGSVQVLRSLDWRDPFRLTMAVSPDGRWIAYSFPPKEQSRNRDIFVLAVEGSSERALVVHEGDDFVIGWAPGGDRLVFASDRGGTLGAWAIQVADGVPGRTPQLLRSPIGGGPLGLSSSGTLFYGIYSGWSDVFTAELDPASGRLVSPPVQVMQRNEGGNSAPDWSPDGSRLVSRSSGPGGYTEQVRLLVRTLDSGRVREVWQDADELNFHFVRWAPDGRSVLAIGPDKKDKQGRYGHVLRIDIETGTTASIAAPVPATPGMILQPEWAPDGRAVYFTRRENFTSRIARLDLTTGVERELFRATRTQWFAISPDGSELAFLAGDTIKTMPALGGTPREVLRGVGVVRTLTWSRDGKYLFYGALVDGDRENRTQLWRVPRTGGAPEKLDLVMSLLTHLRVHPDGRRIAFTAKVRDERQEIWAIDHFIAAAPAAGSGAARR